MGKRDEESVTLFNLCGGPGSGKTTLSYYLAWRLKNEGLLVELVGEAAREEHIYDAPPGHVPPPLLDNQLLLAGQQYERILRLKRHGIVAAISDSPLVMGVMYAEKLPYKTELEKLLRQVEHAFDVRNIFVRRQPGRYIPESRVQRTEAEAAVFDAKARKLLAPFWLEVTRDDAAKLGDAVIEEIRKPR